MKVSQLIHAMDRDDSIVIDDFDAPIDKMNLYSGTVRGIYKDNPINKMHIKSICADDDVILVLVRTEGKRNDTRRSKATS